MKRRRTGIKALPSEMQKNYGQLRELDGRFHEIQKRMEAHCSRAMREVVEAGKDEHLSSDAVLLEHSNRIALFQSECLKLTEEKLALAVQTYELVDSHIQQLDADYNMREEEMGKANESTRAPNHGSQSDGRQDVANGSTGGQKKSRASHVDPNEPTYCYCRQVSYGEMIACDNPECQVEWFHFDCVGVTDRPKGKWFCTECSSTKRRRGK